MDSKFTIFKTGSITYDDDWYVKNNLDVKPVNYTDGFLKNIASITNGSSLEATHGDEIIDVIGYTNDYDFINDELVANVSTNEDLNGMGFSPEFSVNFVDKGDYYEAIDGQLIKVILTDKPRTHILCNSVDGGSNMNEELIDTLNKQIKELNRELAQKEATIEANKERIKEVTKLTDRVTELETEINTYKTQINEFQNQIDGLQPKADAFTKIEDARRSELLTQAFGEDEEAKKAWETASMEQLESLANHREYTVKAQGVPATSTPEPTTGNTEPSAGEKALAFYKKTHNGQEPSFLGTQGGE